MASIRQSLAEVRQSLTDARQSLASLHESLASLHESLASLHESLASLHQSLASVGESLTNNFCPTAGAPEYLELPGKKYPDLFASQNEQAAFQKNLVRQKDEIGRDKLIYPH